MGQLPSVGYHRLIYMNAVRVPVEEIARSTNGLRR